MSRPRIIMRTVREVLRLSLGEGRSIREISSACALPKSTVSDYLKRAREVGLTWPLAPDMSDSALEMQLFGALPLSRQDLGRPMPNWSALHQELKRPHVTLMLLWTEYREQHPDGYGYTQFCAYYRNFTKSLSPTMRQHHVGGEKVFVDFAGDTLPIYDLDGTILFAAQIFVAVLGASNLTYVEALTSQNLYHVIGAHSRAFAFFGGVPRVVVCDNMKTAVTKADRYEPVPNATYLEMATHYQMAVLPTRPYRPRDKPKVEVAVLVVERWILARLRNRQFRSVTEANEEIRSLVTALNNRVTRSLGVSRQKMFDTVERSCLRPLPDTPYEFATWKRAKVSIDYHVIVGADRHYYSVPYRLVGTHVEVRLAENTVQIFSEGVRVALHPRSPIRHGFTTDPAHMPASHRAHLEWTPSRIISWAKTTGPMTSALIEGILERRPHPEQGYRSCLGIMRLGKTYSPERLEAACTRALALHSYSYRSVSSILKNALDGTPLSTGGSHATSGPHHQNVRGPSYYQ